MSKDVVDAAGNAAASGTAAAGTVDGTFTVSVNGTYYIEFFRNNSSATCSFTIDNVLLISNTYLTVKVCDAPAEQYAWGHNGQYKDDEIYGPGNTYTAEYWEYDSRLLRRWNTDPIEYPWQSVYACFNNNPIFYSDPLGLEGNNDGTGGPNKDGKGGDSSVPPEGRPESDHVPVKDDKGVIYTEGNIASGSWELPSIPIESGSGPAPQENSDDSFLGRYNTTVDNFNQSWHESIDNFTGNPVEYTKNFLNGTADGLLYSAFDASYYLYGGFSGIVGVQNAAYQEHWNRNFELADAVGQIPHYTPGQWGQTTAIVLIICTETIVTEKLPIAAKTSSNVLLNTSKQLQAKFKHAGDFGVVGNYSKANAGKFSSAINQHINSAGVQTIQGTYRGQSVIHYVNPSTGLNVISSPTGQFISGWKLNPAQLQNVIKHGGL